MKSKLLILFVIIASSLSAQDARESVDLKVYYGLEREFNSSFEIVNETDQLSHSELRTVLGDFSVAVPFTHGRFNHEIELSRFGFQNTDAKSVLEYKDENTEGAGGENSLNIYLKMKYEIGWLNRNTKRLKPTISLGVEPYFNYTQSIPVVATNFPKRETIIGSAILAVPRLSYDINEKMYLDINIPVGILDFRMKKEVSENPVLTLDQQASTTLDLNVLRSKLQIRLGLGVRL